MPKTEREEQLLTCAQAAAMLGLKEATIRAWIARRTLTYVKISKSVRIPLSAIDELVRQGTVAAK